ncbi:MAG TPA: pseudaminic acid biosynthesis-associated methylase [Terriglobales bacterium]|nr:pseudaminic acid biosynthesis-associated methylase [Terriglobales bacterium]
MADPYETRNLPETKQSEMWRGEFGNQYSERNLLNPPDLDQVYQRNYGVTRTALNRRFLADIPRSASILEVGCNLGNQLILLQQMGFENLNGIEIHEEIVKNAQFRVPLARVIEGSVLKIPFHDASFDLVFTSGLLIHIAPQNLPVAMKEIYRCAKSWIWGFEYHSPQMTEVPYRGQSELLWKADYVRLYTESFPDLELVSEQKLSYLENDNVDSMFLLRRK